MLLWSFIRYTQWNLTACFCSSLSLQCLGIRKILSEFIWVSAGMPEPAGFLPGLDSLDQGSQHTGRVTRTIRHPQNVFFFLWVIFCNDPPVFTESKIFFSTLSQEKSMLSLYTLNKRKLFKIKVLMLPASSLVCWPSRWKTLIWMVMWYLRLQWASYQQTCCNYSNNIINFSLNTYHSHTNNVFISKRDGLLCECPLL